MNRAPIVAVSFGIILAADTPAAGPLSPSEERATFTLPPGFEIELVASESEGIGKFVAVDWDIEGRMWSMTALEYPVDANENPEIARALYAGAARDKVLVWDHPYGPGPHQPRVFAEGLAIPLGILPFKNGVYVQHGPDIVFLSDTNGDGRADRRDVILSGFGVQDSHLFPHQFTRAPGNWIWFAQGAFNYGKVRTTKGAEQQFDRTRMARFRYDGSEFDITSQGPCNIWGLALTIEGECFIQEANDYGYPVMPFHAYANYPGCSDVLFKSYAPEFPGTAPDFRMGGTGLSGLALSDAKGAWPAPYADVMYVANPIIRKIQAIKLHPDGPRYRLEKLPDFIESTDEMFRPVGLRTGPDGCLYIVDWYNKIISHNEVPRNHPERDKKRGRIWRVRHRNQIPFPVPNFRTLPASALVARLGGGSTEQSHLAWQAIVDRRLVELGPGLRRIIAAAGERAGRRIAGLWALEGLHQVDLATLQPLLADPARNIRREAVRALGEAVGDPASLLGAIAPLADDTDPEVRAEVIRVAGPLAATEPRAVALCVQLGRPSLAGPVARSTHNGRMIKVGPAYEREFERYLVRLFLEQHPQAVAQFLDSPAGGSLPVENRMLATLALDPRTSAARVARLLPGLDRAPGDEEVFRLAEYVGEPGVQDALAVMLRRPATARSTIDALLKARNRVDPARLAPLLGEAARALWQGDATARSLALRVTAGFRLASMEEPINMALAGGAPRLEPDEIAPALRALREAGATRLEGVAPLLRSRQREVADEAVLVFASSGNPKAASQLFDSWNELSASQRRSALNVLSGSRMGSSGLLRAVKSGAVPKADLDAATLDKLHLVLGEDPELAQWMSQTATLFQPVLRLDGAHESYVDSRITLQGPFTVETWVKLDEGISNEDGILGAPDSADFNFAGGFFRVWCGAGIGDRVTSRKKMTANAWTHYAVTRDAAGVFRLYVNGEIDVADPRAVTNTFEGLDIGRTIPARGTAGWLTEYRIWNVARTADEIRSACDRSFENDLRPPGLLHYFPGGGPWGKLHGAAKVVKTSDFPPLLTSAEAKKLAVRFAHYRELAGRPGDMVNGRALFSTICMACHSVWGHGGQVGPVLNGAGASGVESLLRNILTPNAAMEAGYRIFRVETTEGDVLDGILVSQDHNAVVLRRPNAEDLRIPQEHVRRAGFIPRSMMPEGLLDGLQPAEITDLFTYLKTLK